MIDNDFLTYIQEQKRHKPLSLTYFVPILYFETIYCVGHAMYTISCNMWGIVLD